MSDLSIYILRVFKPVFGGRYFFGAMGRSFHFVVYLKLFKRVLKVFAVMLGSA